ncbi:MAG: AI-2E family transporter [Verrucomicrobia bacterium RIFCSPLOWO2_12_FULL_64_8]|nr:MAG: AI-2E family transporter [Verrucomicrobia bacterium RIFCSPLOWO2_12_FULL_64_8]
MSSEAPFFTPGQRRMVGFAVALLAFLSTIGLLILSFWVLGRLVAHFSNVLWPLAVAGIIALILRPVVDFYQNGLRVPRLATVVALYALSLLFLAGFVMVLVPPLARQILDLIAFVPTFWQQVTGYVQLHYPEWNDLARGYLSRPEVRHALQSLAEQLQGMLTHALPTLKAAGAGVLNVFTFVTSFAIIPIYLFFFLLARGSPTSRLGEHLPFLSPELRADVVFLASEFVSIVTAFFRGQLLIGLVMGVLLATGFSIVGLKFGFFIGLAFGVLNIVPYLGTIIGLSVALPLAFFQPEGGLLLVALVLVVFTIVQCIEGWFLTPRIMGRQTGLHPVAIIIAIFFWGTALGGVLGMVLAVPLTAFFVTAWRLARRKYFATA